MARRTRDRAGRAERLCRCWQSVQLTCSLALLQFVKASPMMMWCGVGTGSLLSLLVLGAPVAEPPLRVLILDPFGRDVAPFSTAVSTFRTTLARELGEPVDFHEVPLDLARFEAEGEVALVSFLADRIGSRPVDLVVPIGGAGVQFAARNRERLFPDTPVLIVAGDPRFVPPGFLATNATLVTQRVNLSGMVEDILQMQPQTTNIAVVFGASALEHYWVEECRRVFQPFTNQVGFTWLHDLSLEQVLERCATLPPRSFILHGLFVVDAAGVPCERNEALRRLHEVANAPLFGYFESEFGLGSVGGRLYQDAHVGAEGARAAIRILRGERPENIPPQVLEARNPVYDWRELQRWGIKESALPAAGVIEFRQPGFWELYRWPIAGTALFSMLQAALVVGLLVNRVKRRRGEAEAILLADISSKFVNLPPHLVEREIMDAERRICEFLGLDLAALWQWSDQVPGLLMLTHFYRAGDGLQPPEQMNAGEFFPWSQEHMMSGRTMAIASLDELPAEAARDRETYARFGVKSTLVIPLSMGGEPPIGALGFNTTRAEHRWPGVLVKRLQLMAEIFTNALSRKRADQALRESEERLSLAADSAEAGLWVLDCRTQVFWVTEKARGIFGYAAGEVVNMERIQLSVHPDDWDLVERNLQWSLQSGELVNVEYRIRLGEGQERWISSRGRPFLLPNGDPDRLLGLSMDITERKRTEEALRTSESRLAAGTELAGLGYYEFDFAQRTSFVDERFHEICGVPPGQQDLRPLEIWMGQLHPDDRQRVLDERQLMQDGRQDQLSVEYRYLDPVSGVRWIHHLAGVATRDSSGRAARTFGVVRDITEQRHAQMEAQELRGNLAHAGRVTLLGQLASSLAHELSQPLGAILRNAEAAEIMLREASPDLEELQAIVIDIRKDDQRAGQVIDRLRSLLKRRSLDLQPVDLRVVIAEVLSMIHIDATARHVKLTCSDAPTLPAVRGDRIHLQQVLLNLLVNAMDALDGCAPEQRRIQVHAHRLDPGTVEVRVADNGPGFAGTAIGQLFEPFYTTKAKGMGMGLAVSKTIIEAHKGKLWAENVPAGGACFYFTLPVVGGELGSSDR